MNDSSINMVPVFDIFTFGGGREFVVWRRHNCYGRREERRPGEAWFDEKGKVSR
jgi:hypothetical protein